MCSSVVGFLHISKANNFLFLLFFMLKSFGSPSISFFNGKTHGDVDLYKENDLYDML